MDGHFKIIDGDSDKTLLEGDFNTTANENLKLGRLRVYEGSQKLFLIEWTIGDKKYGNHYLFGHPAFSLAKYKTWLNKIALLQSDFNAEDIGK